MFILFQVNNFFNGFIFNYNRRLTLALSYAVKLKANKSNQAYSLVFHLRYFHLYEARPRYIIGIKSHLENLDINMDIITLTHLCPILPWNIKKTTIMMHLPQYKKKKASEEASKCLVAMKEILYGTNDKEPHTETVAQLAQELYNSGLLISLVENLQVIDFEGKKDVCQIFNNILRRQIGTRSPTVEYFCSHQEVLFILLKGYETPQVALNCGIMLRECIRHEPLAKIVLHSEHFKDFFGYVEMSTDTRQSLKLLSELLLDRHNFTVMTRYISKPENLKLMMNLLRDKSPNIQFEAFHVFKVFVANPNKTQPIVDILLKNQTKLIDFLSNFQKDRTDDEQFNDEKTYLVKQIRDLKKPAS
uniref:Calcium binding protein 39-like n=1 Tax=Sinocyclocheilus anshuiensis TaxID=1608454 RepID=A0A671MNY9_9TELE